ncbi:MAG: hypothetical protein JNM84_02295 [Planctomycetes bacterium]|nr:hypothetical protein [Planctomycetota bacterium]
MKIALLVALAAALVGPAAGQDRDGQDPAESAPHRPAARAANDSTEGTPLLLHDNGSFVTSTGNGPSGADLSTLQTSLAMGAYGFTVAHITNSRIADEFSVPPGRMWHIEELSFFAYELGSTSTSSFTDLRFQIWDGTPGDAGSRVVYGDLSTNALSSTEWTRAYRVSENIPTSTSRPIMVCKATPAGGFFLGEGSYWIEFAMGASIASSLFMPPVTILGQTTTGNALVSSSTTWRALIDSGTGTNQGAPFLLRGDDLPVASFDSKWKLSIKPHRDTGLAKARQESKLSFALRPNGSFGCAAIQNGVWWSDKYRYYCDLPLAELQRIVDEQYGVGAVELLSVSAFKCKLLRKLGSSRKPGKLSFSLKARVQTSGDLYIDISATCSGRERVDT